MQCNRYEKIHTGCDCNSCYGRRALNWEEWKEEDLIRYIRAKVAVHGHRVHGYRKSFRRYLHRRIRRKYRRQEYELLLGTRVEADTVIISLGYTD